jgi:BirA family transcriptional regulator, biotin operon repressor / biotin---[acetyl-CoA-carboxylase] ligase
VQQIGHTLIKIKQVDSTNNYAMALVQQGIAKHGFAIFAHEQTNGKGQRGKTWITEPGKNIIISFVLQPFMLAVSQQFLLSMAIANACHQVYYSYAGEATTIKWPNDIYWHDRKAGGMLLENIVQNSKWQFAIAGIGLNINQVKFEDAAAKPVSLKQITGKDFNLDEICTTLSAAIEYWFNALTTLNYQQVVDYFNKHLYKKNQPIYLKKENAVFKTTLIAVNEQGTLITSDSMQRHFNFGEVEWLTGKNM